MSSNTKRPTLIRVPGSDMPSESQRKRSGQRYPRTDAHAMVGARYAFLASCCLSIGWKRATHRFVSKLAWAEIFRSEGSLVVFDCRGDMAGLGTRSVFTD